MRIIFICFLIIYGCKNNDSKHVNSYRTSKSQVILEKSNQSSEQPFTWDAPSDWIPTNNSEFSKGTYLIPSSKGSSVLSISYFSGDAGGITANVNRWRNQLDLPSLDVEKIKAMAEIFTSKIGEYQVYTIINPENPEALLCSIIPTNNYTIFIKLKTYPDTINDFKEQFIEFCSSFNYNE